MNNGRKLAYPCNFVVQKHPLVHYMILYKSIPRNVVDFPRNYAEITLIYKGLVLRTEYTDLFSHFDKLLKSMQTIVYIP